MAFDYINEAFKRLDLLEEQMFDTSVDGINKLSDFIDDGDEDDLVRVIDPEANTSDEIQDSYVGKVIVNCNICHSHIFENKEEIKIEDDGSVNIEEQCPYCGEQEGFTIVGEIAPYGESDADTDVSDDDETSTNVDDTSIETDSESNLEESLIGTALAAGAGAIVGNAISKRLKENNDESNESVKMSRATRRAMQEARINEDFKEVSITTEDQHMEMTSDENGKVTVTTEPVTSDPVADETIVPVSSETEQEILDNNAEVSDEVESEGSEESNEVDSESSEEEFDLEEVDEEGMNELGESYLRKVYDNVKSFKTTSVGANSTALVVEGLITFDSGVEKKTGFIFEAKDINERGQLRFTGSNKHISEAMDAFTLVGRLDNKKLFVESLKYNYNVNKDSVRGIVRRK